METVFKIFSSINQVHLPFLVTKKYLSDASFLFFINLFNSEKLESNSIFLNGFNLSSETLLNLSIFSILKNWLSDFEELTPNNPKKERIKP